MRKFRRFRRRLWSREARYTNALYGDRGVPTQLGLCLTGSCNLRCPYCMRETFTPPNKTLSLQDVKSIMKRMPFISGVCIMGLCEPLLNPETPDILRWLKKEADYSVSFTTNGSIPLNDDRLDALLCIDDMVFSIDTSDEETFNILRKGTRLQTVMDNLFRLIRFKWENGLGKHDNPPIHINAVITSLNLLQIPGLIEMLEPYSDDLTYLMVDPVSRPDYSPFQPLVLERSKLRRELPDLRVYAKASPLQVLGLDYLLEPSFNWSRCHLSWNSMFLEPNGDVYFCYDYKYILGNIWKTDPLKIWNNERARAFRKKLQSSTPPINQCRSCNFARGGWQIGGQYNIKKEDEVED